MIQFRQLRRLVLLTILPFLFTACGTFEGFDDSLDDPAAAGELVFVPQPLPDPDIPVEVGARQEDPGDEAGTLRNAFREAYLEALYRGLPLTGVLGGDRVNPWPAGAPASWSQNWMSADKEDNSWGTPALVLALGTYGGESALFFPVYSVSGPILDQYGKSAGYNRANGAAGYGVPLGEVFFFEGTAVQRFSRGRMITSRAETPDSAKVTRFSFGEDRFYSLLSDLSASEKTREFGGRFPDEVREAFAFAWAYTFADKEGESDGAVVQVEFSTPWVLAGEDAITLNGFFYKSYNEGKDILVLLDGKNLPRRVHYLSGPILQVLISRSQIPGLEREKALGSSAGSALGRFLTDSFARYGPPMSDPLPVPLDFLSGDEVSKTSEKKPAVEQDPSAPLFLEAQRFSRGWIVVAPKKETPAVLPQSAEIPPVGIPPVEAPADQAETDGESETDNGTDSAENSYNPVW
ncbi:hypothetical protein AGMMS50230_17920 [Spirochaetia bacterium]|nr:hypothetical protein AGMMS50230_17920 [Spirochaetia bacterium]